MKKVLILGGYGNFGARIAEALLKKGIRVIIAGRDQTKATKLQEILRSRISPELISIAIFDANKDLSNQLDSLEPFIVINTIGPFQITDYSIIKTCIEKKIHYIDLADARDFVCNITTLNDSAIRHNVLVVSGASTVPGLSSAVIEHYKQYFVTINSLKYGISPGQKAPRGLATTESILTYLGKPLKPWGDLKSARYGWQNLYLQYYPELGNRWMANCDIPDLDLFGPKYNINHLEFSAGMENSMLHLGMWMLSHLIRLGIPFNLSKYAKSLLQLSHWFDFFGSQNGGMHMIFRGVNKEGEQMEIKWFITAKNNDGPQIPCVPAILLAQKIIEDKLSITGALPCIGLITLKEYLNELKHFSIKQFEFKKIIS